MKNYLQYRNPISNKRGIFTRERIKNMSSEKFKKCETQIIAQLKDIGIPYTFEIGAKKIYNNMPEIIYDDTKPDSEIIGYEWIAFDGACEICSMLDGMVFNTIEQIPNKIHPNCRCEVYAIYYF